MRILVDWENLRITLHCKGYVANPVVVLSSMLTALESALGPIPAGGSSIELFFRDGFETASDQAALSARRDAAVDIGYVWEGKDMADFEIALAAMEHHFEAPAVDLWVVSSDNDLARLVERLVVRARRVQSAGVIGVVAFDTFPGILKGEKSPRPPALWIKGPLETSLASCIGPPLDRRPPTRWDGPAWAFRVRMAARMNDAVPRELLSKAARASGMSFDWDVVAKTALDDVGAEIVDAAVARLWRDSWGGPFSPAEARDRLRQSGAQLSEEELSGLLAALAMAGLVRYLSAESLEVPSAWREGFLHPARRLVLFVASRHDVRRSGALDRHRSKLARRGGGELSDTDKVDALDSFEIVARTLTRRKVLHERERSALAVNGEHPFVVRTKATANQVLGQLRDACFEDEARRRVALLPVHDPKRWLRVLREVGLAERGRDGRWRIGQLARRAPWTDGARNGDAASPS